MAEKQQERQCVEFDPEEFCCSVCLDLLRDPVTVPCGHTYCRSCIERCWDREKEKGRYSCPQCRDTCSQRPALGRNTMLAEVVEKLKMTEAKPAPPSSPAGPQHVPCDFCRGAMRNRATTSCLTCLASYCPDHLEPHYRVPVLKMHHLVTATVPLQQKVCTKHHKLMEVYCHTDGRCICCLCTMDEHKGHRTVSAVAKRAADQRLLSECQSAVKLRSQERQSQLRELVQAVTDFKTSSETAVKSCDEIFDKLIAVVQGKRPLAKQLIRAREEAAVEQAEALQLQLEVEIAKLRMRDADLEELSHTADHIHFIQTFQSLSTSCESPDLPAGSVCSQGSMETVIDSLSELSDEMTDFLKTAWSKIPATVSAVDVVLPPVPTTREEFLRYGRPLTLDPNSVNKYFSLSLNSQRVTSKSYGMLYSPHPDRFTDVKQVLCREGLTGRSYWEVSLGDGVWLVAVSYKDICRTTFDSEFGKNRKSWSLECSGDGYTFRHGWATKTVSGPKCSQIGVYLDYGAGTLSFYSASGRMTLLHEECTLFRQPLHPGLGLKGGRSGCHAEIKVP